MMLIIIFINILNDFYLYKNKYFNLLKKFNCHQIIYIKLHLLIIIIFRVQTFVFHEKLLITLYFFDKSHYFDQECINYSAANSFLWGFRILELNLLVEEAIFIWKIDLKSLKILVSIHIIEYFVDCFRNNSRNLLDSG